MKTLLSICSFLIAFPLLAHDLWLEDSNDGRSVIRYGHSGVTHQGDNYLPYTAHEIKTANCFADQSVQSIAISNETPVSLHHGCDMQWIVFSTGFWSKTPQGTVNKARNKLPAVYQSWLSQESLKRMTKWHNRFSQPITEDFELVAEENPLLLGVGDKMRLRVFDHGQPVANVVVAYLGEPRGVTDEQGNINIRIQQSGLQLIQASKVESYPDKTLADQVIQTTALQVFIP